MKKFTILYLFISGIAFSQNLNYKLPINIPKDSSLNAASLMITYDLVNENYKLYSPYEYIFKSKILSGQLVGDSIDFGILRLSYIDIPASYNGTTLTFEVYSDSLKQWVELNDSYGSLFTITLSSTKLGRYVVDPPFWATIRKIRPKANTPQIQDIDIYFGVRIY